MLYFLYFFFRYILNELEVMSIEKCNFIFLVIYFCIYYWNVLKKNVDDNYSIKDMIC